MAIGANNDQLDEKTRTDFYKRSLKILKSAKIPFLVGGAYAMHNYTGRYRDTKDLDLFINPGDCKSTLDVFTRAGFETAVTFEHWLAKSTWNGHLIDIVFNSGNAIGEVDDQWFKRAIYGNLFDIEVRFVPPEEMIWSKAFVMERERYDGADVNHIILACGKEIDWKLLLDRFGPHWRLLLGHLVLFGFVYPSERGLIPAWVMSELLSRLKEETAAHSDDRFCLGTLLSREQYRVDVDRLGFTDPRRPPRGKMTREQIQKWDAGASPPGCKQVSD
ncbi:MAG: nucleotidyltransferase [Syntrophobacteraceae bacterium]|nr:nucleotidyltransferase [Syntrophobacteraceae bacterium]